MQGQPEYLSQSVMCAFYWKGGIEMVSFKWWVGGTLRFFRVHTWPKNPIMAEYLSAYLSPDTSAGALAIFDIRYEILLLYYLPVKITSLNLNTSVVNPTTLFIPPLLPSTLSLFPLHHLPSYQPLSTCENSFLNYENMKHRWLCFKIIIKYYNNTNSSCDIILTT